MGVVFAFVLVLGGLAAIYRSVKGEPGAALAGLGLAAAAVSTAIVVAHAGVELAALREAALVRINVYPEGNVASILVAEALILVSYGLFVFFIILLGVTVILYGLAVAISNTYPGWLGWVAATVPIATSSAGLRSKRNWNRSDVIPFDLFQGPAWC